MGIRPASVREADGWREEDMLRTAAAVGFNETTFIQKSGKADVCLRCFTPGHEMDLCGHATVASLYHLKSDPGPPPVRALSGKPPQFGACDRIGRIGPSSGAANRIREHRNLDLARSRGGYACEAFFFPVLRNAARAGAGSPHHRQGGLRERDGYSVFLSPRSNNGQLTCIKPEVHSHTI
jgi:hypothetical protein